MSNMENDPTRSDALSGWDSLNSDIVDVTGGVVDTTRRPLRESLRKLLKPRPAPPSPPESQGEDKPK